MPIYVYETTDSSKPIRRFEYKQSMKDEPLRVDPEVVEQRRVRGQRSGRARLQRNRTGATGYWRAHWRQMCKPLEEVVGMRLR